MAEKTPLQQLVEGLITEVGVPIAHYSYIRFMSPVVNRYFVEYPDIDWKNVAIDVSNVTVLSAEFPTGSAQYWLLEVINAGIRNTENIFGIDIIESDGLDMLHTFANHLTEDYDLFYESVSGSVSGSV